ncbi:N-acetylmuramoyl-L-alanine amidase-like domain-containing protein [Paucibacter sp. JuS9]|uniref:N-acetylmuramoyl-L-alanine amidase-like domain-containing protein n=1 Tax=Roseateles TaxID=93681 RepID=UPI002FE66BCC
MKIAAPPTLVTAAIALLLAGCATSPAPVIAPRIEATAVQLEAARRVALPPEQLSEMLNKPWHKMQPAELGRFLGWQQLDQPLLRQRVAALARKNIGQPYELYLLGEFPYETYDSQPLFSLAKSDCVVFVEHVYAMALSASWEEFFWMLQRIRYRDGVIGAATRNHYTEADWNPANSWLVTDITKELAGDKVTPYRQRIDRKAFLKKQFKIERDIPVQQFDDVFVPKEAVAQIEAGLQEGDFVNVISGKDGGYWASHVGLIVLGKDGNRHILHSAEPEVREETLQGFIARLAERDARNAGQNKASLAGFKFLRLNEAPQAPPMAPQPRPARPALLG